MSAVFEVLSPGLQTTVQDLGRWGFQSVGVPVSGPMDPFAHRLANALVGNPRAAATLEITITGPSLRFEASRAVAVAGAHFELFLDEQPVAPHTTFVVRDGSVLRFGARHGGARAYLAVAGGIDTRPVLGSRATHVPTATGGFEGRPLRRGDRVPLGDWTRPTTPPKVTPPVGSSAPETPVVRVLPGSQLDRFMPDALEAFVSAPYHVGVQSDRMGFRLSGPTLRHRPGGADIISDALPVGTVQVPASGEPLVLLADRQTAGGYAKLATVISADIGILGQTAPGDPVRFRACTHADALEALVARERPLMALEAEGV